MFNSKINRGTAFFLLFLLMLPLAAFAGGKKEETKEKEMDEPVNTTQDTAVSSEREPLGVIAAEAAAIVNGSIISLKSYNRQVQLIIQQYASQGVRFQDAQLADFKIKILDNLIDQELLYQDAVSNGSSISYEAVDVQLEVIKGQFPDESAYKNELASRGMTEEEVRSDLGRDILVEGFITSKFGPLIKIEDSDIMKFYEENDQYFSKPEQVRASHILIKVDPDAEESVKKDALERINAIKTRLTNGEEFSELARTLSEGPSNVGGGDLGPFGRGQMAKSFEDAAFSMNVGDVSDIVETQFGYHLIRLTAKNAQTTLSFAEVREHIVNRLTLLKRANMVNGYISTIKPDAVIEILVD